jgi:hypothetical protein
MDSPAENLGLATLRGGQPQNEGKWVFAEMVASCDPNVRFWLNANQFKDRSLWQAGWQSVGEMEEMEEDVL